MLFISQLFVRGFLSNLLGEKNILSYLEERKLWSYLSIGQIFYPNQNLEREEDGKWISILIF